MHMCMSVWYIQNLSSTLPHVCDPIPVAMQGSHTCGNVLHSWTLAVSVHQNKVMQAMIFFTTLWLNSAFVLSCRCSLAMPELPKLCKFSSSQAISLQYLIVITSNWVQRSLRGLGMFAYTALLKCLPQSKLHTIFHHIFLFCKLLKHWHFVILLTVNSTFKYNQFWSVQVFDQNLVPTPPEMILYTETTFIGLNWYRLSFTASFILIGLTVASGKGDCLFTQSHADQG